MPKLSCKPSKANCFVIRGADAELHGDFDHTGRLDYSKSERQQRYTRPGAIILPNLNLSKGLPAGWTVGDDLSTKRDCDDDRIQGATDLHELSKLEVRSPATTLLADELLLRVVAEDLKRIRIFRRDPAEPDVGKWNAVLGGGAGNDANVKFLPNTSWSEEFVIEALTLAGSPASKAPPPTGPTPKEPLEPPKINSSTGEGSSPKNSGNPIYPDRFPGEVWLELIHKQARAPMTNNFDVAVFLIAPFLLQSNLEPCERLYVAYHEDYNHGFVYDLMEAAWAAFAAPGTFNRDSSLLFNPSTPADLSNPRNDTAGAQALSPGQLYLIDMPPPFDPWVQDAFEMGYCSAPDGKAFNVVLHCKRGGDLADFVKNELAGTDIALFNELEDAPQDSTDFGGNIEVSPPVSNTSKALVKDDGGPSVKAHEKAPFGKIILGDNNNTHRTGSGKVHDETRNFLQAQVVQPIIPLNTSWLGVAHVDEFMSFVPANTKRKSCLLIASVHAMDLLLEEIKNVKVEDGRTNFHRGKFERFGHWHTYSEVSAEKLLTGPVGKYSKKIRNKFMKPIQSRLMICTDHKKQDVIKIPIYFKPGTDPNAEFGSPLNRTVAETVGMVNMQVANGHLFVPKPFGPRMPRKTAEKIVKRILKRLGMGKTNVQSLSDTEHHYWAQPDLSLDRVAQFFTHPDTAADRDEIIEKIKNPAHALSSTLQALVDARKVEIEGANNTGPSKIADVTDASGIFTKWKRLTIPEKPSVDIIETYMLSVLSHIGCKVHFVDDWIYHVGWGEAHCATNAKRRPPSAGSLKKKWWEVYDPKRDTSYDPSS